MDSWSMRTNQDDEIVISRAGQAMYVQVTREEGRKFILILGPAEAHALAHELEGK